MANVIAATAAAAISSDIVIAAGDSATFTTIGKFVLGEQCAINVKGSDGSYTLIRAEPLPGQVLNAVLDSIVNTRVISNPATTSMTVLLVKTASASSVGIDQY